MNDFGQWLDGEIRERGWSRREFAERTTVAGRRPLSSVAIDKYISGEIREPSIAAARGIAKALSVSVDEVLARAGSMPVQPDMPPRLKELARRLLALPGPAQTEVLDALTLLVGQAEGRAGRLPSLGGE
jgi:transcriptional regulator with XRE-family HTH domain